MKRQKHEHHELLLKDIHLASNWAESNSHYRIQLFLIVSCLLYVHDATVFAKEDETVTGGLCVCICLLSETENECLDRQIILSL